jgi:CheY-like chemotaxis protein
MRVLVVDDEENLANLLVMVLQHGGHEATAAYDGRAGLKKADSFAPDCVISDVIMPGMNGLELCASIAARHPDCHILLFSGQAIVNELLQAARQAGYNWELLHKPMDPEELLEKLASLQPASDDH